VLLEHPLYLDFLSMVGGWDNDAAWMKWRPDEGTKVHVVTLDGSKVRGLQAANNCTFRDVLNCRCICRWRRYSDRWSRRGEFS
jgi:carotenoid cleavage dioxygenase-like enzyme